MRGFGGTKNNNVLARLFNDLATFFKELPQNTVAGSFPTVAGSFFQHVLATQIVGNIVLIGGIFITICGKDLIIGYVFMTIPHPTLPNTCIALTRL
jgi:hypothetical protein